MPNRTKILKVEDLPDICTPQIVADYLGIARERVYEFCQIKPEFGGIRSYTIGASRKIDKPDLLDWKQRMKEAK